MDDLKNIKIIEKVMPAVVSIILDKAGVLSSKYAPKDEVKRGDFKALNDKKEKIEIGGGSGFFINKEGLILTNKHILSIFSDSVYKIITSGDEEFTARVISRDPINDIAILKINENAGRNFPFLKLGDSSKIKLGQNVFAFGNVLGIFRNTVSAGIISGLSRAVLAKTADGKNALQELRGLIQTDAAINPGNSGGPLINLKGEVIGINVAVVAGAQNISFAIPINSAKRDIADIMKYGRIKRPFLGVRFISVTEELSNKLKLPEKFGLFVTKEHESDEAVIKNSPAYKAGIKENDILMFWNGKPLKDNNFEQFLEKANVGEKVKIRFIRKINPNSNIYKAFNTEVILGERK